MNAADRFALAMRRMPRLLLALLLVLAAPAAHAQRGEIVSRHDDWTLRRAGDGQQDRLCYLAVSGTEGPGSMSLLLVPENEGRLALAFLVSGITVADPDPDDSLFLVFTREGQAEPVRSVRFRMPRPRQLQERPPLARLTLTFGARGVQLFSADLRSSSSLLVKLPRNQDFFLTTTGFAAAWEALKACDPARGAQLP